ncbi:MAG TPA: citrate/2-methylcitrate synthase [Candidatus Saccharimonadia bacterium]|nr:citrate/2-methylcitrate synthase [Candidatus Saccharimonadia bacterium]
MTRLDIPKLRKLDPRILCLGNHRGIIQSILDFDFLAGRTSPSIMGIINTGRNVERYFYGRREITIPVYGDIDQVPSELGNQTNLFINVFSGRRVLRSSRAAMELLPNLVGGVVFAEGLPEQHAIQLYSEAQTRGIWMIGGASVGLVLPAVMKLGAIGGTQAAQLIQSQLFTPGSVAVISSSGGMVNEIIRTVASSGHSLSFSLALGGERFPMVTPQMAFQAAQDDPDTSVIAYFGELGGQDEYLLVDMLKSGTVTKPVLTYIAGAVADLFDTPPQFGHAKAMAAHADESARAKAEALRSAGAQVAEQYEDFVQSIRALPQASSNIVQPEYEDLTNRKPAMFASTVSGDKQNDVNVLNQDLLSFAEQNSFAHIAVSMFLGRDIASLELEEFVDFVLRLLVDHGPYVSGAVNTIVAARAGKDLVSSLASGLLTIGPRFGGAINQAAVTWLEGVSSNQTPAAMVEDMAKRRQRIAGIGHRKYRADAPDPRVTRLLRFTSGLSAKRFTTFARGVESETISKKASLILNVDGTIAAVLLDILAEKEGYTDDQLLSLTNTEFFNALFVLSRSVGFMAHYFDQVRLDEGLFRLNPDEVAYLPSEPESDKAAHKQP